MHFKFTFSRVSRKKGESHIFHLSFMSYLKKPRQNLTDFLFLLKSHLLQELSFQLMFSFS